MLTTVKIINYLFSMNNCYVKASKSYENLMNLPQELLLILTLILIFLVICDRLLPGKVVLNKSVFEKPNVDY